MPSLEGSWHRRIQRHLPTPIKIALKQVTAALEPRGPGLPRRRSAIDEYVVQAPSAESAIRLFLGEWASRLPGFESLTGKSDLFDDERVRWFDELSPFKDRTVLELGPLEAGHTKMMAQLGARKVTAIEANSRAYLKCLIAKEIYGIERAEFLLGSFDRFLEHAPAGARWDCIFACGVLYHSQDPLHLLDLICAHTERVFIWSHYYDRQVLERSAAFSRRFSATVERELDGFKASYHRQHYHTSLYAKGFTGGVGQTSYWMPREAIVGFLKHRGFTKQQIGFDDPAHENGPAFALAAFR